MREQERYVVVVDAVIGGGVRYMQGQAVTAEELGELVEPLLREGAIVAVGAALSIKDRISLR